MRKSLFIALSALLMGALAYGATTSTPSVPQPADVESLLNRSVVHAPRVKLGSQVTLKKVNVMKAVWDFSVLGGGSTAALVLKDAAGGSAVLPKGAVIKRVMIDEVTNVTGNSGALMSFGINTAVDLKAATAVAAFANAIDGIPTGSASTSVKVTTANSAVTTTVTGNSVTAGKLNLFIEYYLSD